MGELSVQVKEAKMAGSVVFYVLELVADCSALEIRRTRHLTTLQPLPDCFAAEPAGVQLGGHWTPCRVV